ncbi:MAG: lipoate--protein ligase family protein [Anaerolineae bacterium]|nr:lipoate--protein ligase family protein [Anaerolineae bacterium]
MNERATWRLLPEATFDGAFNMALDEAVLEAVGAGESPPTMRFYRWDPPCLSIGYSQKIASFDRQALSDHGWHLVRRPSGGRAVLHRDEVTYSIAAPAEDWRLAGGVLESYRRISGAFLHGLEGLGVCLTDEAEGDSAGPRSAACFDAPSRHELTANGRKLVGSAQWRHGAGVLQHGSVPLSGDVAEVVGYLALSESDRERARALLRRRAATVEQALGTKPGFTEVANAIAQGLSALLAVDWVPGEPTPKELARAAQLRSTRYGTDAWNFRL